MYLLQSALSFRWLRNCILLLLLFFVAACSSGPSSGPSGSAKTGTTTSPSSPSASTPLLPGQQIWKDGVSSFLFGTNDTYEWSDHNIQTEPAVQAALRSGGFTLIRSFFPDNASDAAIEQRIQTIENSGAHCLGVITNITNLTYDQHLVRYLGKRCLMYEFGNESDINGFTVQAYLARWNKTIPLLRQINPDAKFFGPVTYSYRGNHDFLQAFLQGVKVSGVLPDAVSFHAYACYEQPEGPCLGEASEYKTVSLYVESLVHSILGKNIPVGITEWNYDPSNPPPAYGEDPKFITPFTVNSLHAMIQAGIAFACQFDAASYAGYGRLDMFYQDNAQPKPQYYAIKSVIDQYRPASP